MMKKLSKRFAATLMSLMMVLTLLPASAMAAQESSDIDDHPDASLQLYEKELKLDIDETQYLHVLETSPSYGMGHKLHWSVRWSSENPSIATVDNSGAVTGVTAGETTITATATAEYLYQGHWKYYGCDSKTVPVTVSNLPPISIQLDQTDLELEKDGTQTIHISEITPSTYHNLLIGWSVEWSSENPSVATVDNSGVVTGVAEGETTITARVTGEYFHGGQCLYYGTESKTVNVKVSNPASGSLQLDET